jgi:hypothetical protein
MKRVTLLRVTALVALAGLTAIPSAAHAQALTMQMGNGWSFSFSGNVNAFLVYQLSNVGDSGKVINGGLTPVEGTNPRIRTGLLPAFATFDVKGKEGPLNLGVHFGFAPEIQNGGGALGNIHDNFGNGTQAGAQIDMRQVYLTLSGDWGQILAGREIGLFDRQNILQDMTLFGVGATGGNIGAGGTALGRIGYGYVYPNFVPQITYSTSASNSVQWAIGIFDPSAVGGTGAGTSAFIYNRIPRLETELSWTGNMSGGGQPGASTNTIMAWVGGLWQEAYNAPTGGSSVSSVGADGGVKISMDHVSIVGAGYVGKGIGSTLLLTSALATDGAGSARTSYGGYVQVVGKLDSHWSVGGSFGGSLLSATSADNADVVDGPALLKSNIDGSAMLTYQWTKALRWVAEYDWTQSKNQGSTAFPQQSVQASQLASGFMLFF